MDLTAALPSQAMAFTIADDELLAGINTIYQDLDDITMVEDGGLLQQNGIGLIQGRCEGAGEAPEETVHSQFDPKVVGMGVLPHTEPDSAWRLSRHLPEALEETPEARDGLVEYGWRLGSACDGRGQIL